MFGLLGRLLRRTPLASVARTGLYSPRFMRDGSTTAEMQIVRVNPWYYKVLVNRSYQYVNTWMSGDTYEFDSEGCNHIIAEFREHLGSGNVVVIRDDRN